VAGELPVVRALAGTGADIRSSVAREGATYFLSGEKHLITFGTVADFLLLFARLEGTSGAAEEGDCGPTAVPAWRYSSTNGRVATALFRVRNNTGQDIVWKPTWYYTSWDGWAERASAAVNGQEIWDATCGGGTCSTQQSFTIPKSRTSTVIFVSTGNSNASPCCNIHVRKVVLAFYNNALQLPAGLEFIDDLDTATGTTAEGSTEDMAREPAVSVWTTAQSSPAAQRRGRYIAASTAHPAKMLPSVAAYAIAHYTEPGDLVLDPMCGIGTTWVEAVHARRRAVGVEYEPHRDPPWDPFAAKTGLV